VVSNARHALRWSNVEGTLTARVVVDKNRKTAIEVSRQAGMVKFIPLVIDGFDTENELVLDFDKRWRDAAYPLERCAKLFVGYAQDIGATKDALIELAKWTKVSDKESQAALQRMSARRTTPTVSPGPSQGPRQSTGGRPKGFTLLPVEEENPGVWETTPTVISGGGTLAVTSGGTGLNPALEKARAALAKLKAGKK